ncbi:MAG: outer membrane lipoprotein carrier protein LolA [Bacteroidetes bacterium]|nr:outer membrane lipoprotein carrier protein LolA [Bacteroidota bacterium]
MKYLSVLFIHFILVTTLLAQSAPPAEKSDPEAKKVLDKVRKKYEAYNTVEAGFSLQIEVPGQPKEVQKGTISQKGEQFRLDMDQQLIVSNGKTTWVYLKKNNEVQITDSDPKGTENGFMTPRDLLKRYQKGDFLYAITEKTTENGKVITQIEFKPKDKNSEYSKMRLSLDEKASEIKSIKAFAKDGSRYTFNINRLSPNKPMGVEVFYFDVKKFPGVKVEDLRM